MLRAEDSAFLTELYQSMVQRFDLEEFRSLCFQLQVDDENLGGEGKAAKIRELILLSIREAWLENLIEIVQKERPQFNWPVIPDDFDGRFAGEPDPDLWTLRQPQRPNFSQTDKNRRSELALLAKVRHFWIEGVLERSVHQTLMIEIGKEVVFGEGVQLQPWDMALETPVTTEPVKWKNDNLIDLFDGTLHSLLILGAPGSGKTITLLNLAQALLLQAEADAAQPLPVVFNLSLWREQSGSFADWMVEELNRTYQIPTRIGQTWVEEDDLFLLLDGLDEVDEASQAACVETINAFQQTHSLMPMVVCSRMGDYEEIGVALNAQQVVKLLPLTPTQIDDYLTQMGDKMQSLRLALQQDVALQEMAQTPLLLSIMSLVLGGSEEETAVATSNSMAGETQRRLFDAYIQRMFQRRGGRTDFDLPTTHKWLHHLAHYLRQSSQTIFQIEYIQPDWLTHPRDQWLYVGLTRLSLGLSLGLGFTALNFVLRRGVPIIPRILGGFLPGVIASLFISLFDGLFFQRAKQPLSRSRRLIIIFLLAAVSGGPFITLGAFDFSLTFLVSSSLFVGIPFALLAGYRMGGYTHDDIRPVEALQWNWQQCVRGLGVGFLIGLIVTTVLSLVIILVGSGVRWIVAGVPINLSNFAELARVLLPPFALSGLVIGGLQGRPLVEVVTPNQGIWQSKRNALLAGLLFLILSFVVGFIIFALSGEIEEGAFWQMTWNATAVFMLLLAPLMVIIGMLWYGGVAVIQHYLLREVLIWRRLIARKLIPFMDFTVERILLQRVGGAYTYIHRLMLDYFAAETKDVQFTPHDTQTS